MDRIEGNVGDDSDQTAIGKDIKQEKNIGGQSVVHVYPTDKRRRKTGRLMPDEAQELRLALDKLRNEISQSNIVVTRLEGTVGRNNDITLQSISAFEKQLAVFKEQLKTRAPVWIAYVSVALLAVLASAATIVTIIWIAQR